MIVLSRYRHQLSLLLNGFQMLGSLHPLLQWHQVSYVASVLINLRNKQTGKVLIKSRFLIPILHNCLRTIIPGWGERFLHACLGWPPAASYARLRIVLLPEIRGCVSGVSQGGFGPRIGHSYSMSVSLRQVLVIVGILPPSIQILMILDRFFFPLDHIAPVAVHLCRIHVLCGIEHFILDPGVLRELSDFLCWILVWCCLCTHLQIKLKLVIIQDNN